jgi:hypothetical protein
MRRTVIFIAGIGSIATMALAGEPPILYKNSYSEHRHKPRWEAKEAPMGDSAKLDAMTGGPIAIGVASQLPCTNRTLLPSGKTRAHDPLAPRCVKAPPQPPICAIGTSFEIARFMTSERSNRWHANWWRPNNLAGGLYKSNCRGIEWPIRTWPIDAFEKLHTN